MFAVAMALWGHANPKGASIFPSAESVGTLIGASRKSVEKYRTALVELRMIELVSQGKGTGDSSRYLLRDPGEWRTVAAEFEAAMAAVPVPATPEPETLASPEPEPEPEEERVRVALRGAPNRKVLTQVRTEWARAIESDAVLNHLYCTLATEFQRKENR